MRGARWLERCGVRGARCEVGLRVRSASHPSGDDQAGDEAGDNQHH